MIKPAWASLATVLAWMLSGAASAQALSREEAYDIAREAYVYAYPLVTMDVTMRQATNVSDAQTVSMRAPVNQFAHVRTYPKAEAREVVRLNFDTLYSSAWLDVSREPIVLSVPEMTDRYYLLPMLDMWTDVFSVVGTRTTGSKAGNYAIVGPDWTGTLPAGLVKIVAPTPRVWILGRTQTNGASDFERVHKVQDGYRLTPLSQWGKPAVTPSAAATDSTVDTKTPPLKQINAMDGITMLGRLAQLMASNPPHANDYPILFRMRRLGLEPGQPFDASRLDPALVKLINAAASDALKDVEKAGKSGAGLDRANGWSYSLRSGTYATSYKNRAMAALIGLGVNLSEDAIYPFTFVDGDGKRLGGENRYVLHFDKGNMPPAQAFWSLTLYDKDGFQIANPLNRFAVGDHFGDNTLKANADGSIDIYIQNESPGDEKQSNWLPAPKDEFNLALRLYSPAQAMRDGAWAPPPVKRVN